MPKPQIGVLTNKNGGGIKTIYHLHSRQFGVLGMGLHALWAVQCTSHVSEANAKLSQQVKPHLLPHLFRQHNHILTDAEEHLHRLHVVFNWFRKYNLKFKPSKCSLFKEEINYLVHQVSKEGVQPSNWNLKAIAECALPQTYMEI